MQKFVTDITHLPTQNKTSLSGSSGTIYRVDEKTYFKLLNEDYRNLRESENKEFLDTLIALSECTSSPSLALPEIIYRNEDVLYGYTMPIMPGILLADISNTTRIKDLLTAFSSLEPELAKLAEIYFKTEDISEDNLLYSTLFHLIDLELGIIDKSCSKEYLAKRNYYQIFAVLGQRIYGRNITRSFPYSPVQDLNMKLKDTTSTDYEAFFNALNNYLSNESTSEIETIADAKNATAKIFQKQKM